MAASGTVEYNVHLTSDPGGTVVVTPTSSDTAKATVSSALTFTSSNWRTAQQITVTGAADGSTTITHAVTTATTAYPQSLTIDPVSVTVAGPLQLSFDTGSYTVVEGDGSVSVTVNASRAPASDLTVNLTTGNGTTQGAADFTAPPATFTFPANMTSHTFSVTIANDNTKEGHERFRLTLASGTGYSVGSPASTDVTILNDDGSVNVTLGKSGGDANGNIVEGASDGTEYIDITVTLGRVLRGGERINAGIFFTGASRNTDYTLALHPSSQTGVSLQTTRLGASEQNPGVQLDGAGAWRATLRLTAVDNDDRTQPFVDIRLKTDTNARVRPFPESVTLGTVHTGPVQFVILDDETGDIVVPEGWSLAPSGVAGGGDFRLFFLSSTQRNANPTNIDVYNNWIRKLIADNGHAAIKPYAGFFRVFGSTSGANARVHNDMWTGSAWTDASKNANDAGTAIYWLNGLKVADNYWDFCDNSWDNRNHGSGLQVRLENGNLAIHSTPRTYVFTGTNATCTSGGNVLGANNVKVGFGTRGSNIDTQGLHHTSQSNRTLPKGNNRPFWGMSAAFTKATPPELEFSAATYSGAEDGGTINVTVTADKAPSSALTVTLDTTAGTATGGGTDYTTPAATFTFPAGQTSRIVPVTITDDSVAEGSETFTMTLTAATGYTVGTQSSTTVTITDDDALSVMMMGSDGDAGGNAVEGANNATGYRTVTLTLGQAPAAGQTVTVPLTVTGATVTTDYTFTLMPATQSGVTLDTSSPHSAQNPAVVFAAGATTATFRLTPVDNDDRTQPYVYIDYGTGARAPSATGGIMLGKPADPQGVALVDDETGDIEVLSTWGLAPSGLSVGDDFRLLFRTSTGRDATSSDIAVYDAFVRGVLVDNGHPDIKRYAGFFKVFGGTRVQNGSTGTSVRVHNGMASTHTGHHAGTNDMWADGSTRATVGSTEGTPTYWLNGVRLANNYADMCDINWSGGNGVTTGWGRAAPRSEDGTRNVPANPPGNDFGPYSTWTGSGNACEAWIYPLGAARVSRSSAGSGGGQSLLHQTDAANTNIHPLYGYSPVFKLVLPPPALSFGAQTYSGSEGDGTIDVTVTATRAPSSPLTVTLTTTDGTATDGTDFTAPASTFIFPANMTSYTISVTVSNDSTVEADKDFTLTLGGGRGYTLASPTSTTVTILDDDGISVEMSASDGDADGNAVEGAGNATGYRTITLTLSRALTGSETVTVPLSVTGATVTTDYTFALQPSTQTGVTLTTSGTHTAQNPAVEFASGATTATLRLTPVDNNARTQPYVIVDYGTGGTAPSATGGISLGTPRGGPISIVLVDDETGDIVLPPGADFRPQVGNNAEYRLIFMTSGGGPATSADIADYDHFVRSAAIRSGDAALLPYVGFFKAFVSTATVDGREHVGIWDPTLRGGSGGYTDGSTGLNSGGTDVYWLGGASLTVNNYFRVCNSEWDSRWSSESTRLRHEDVSEGDGAKVWTGMDNNCVTSANPLGSATPTYGPGTQAGSGTHSQALSLGTEAATNTNRFYAVSDVVKSEASAAMPLVQFSQRSISGNEKDLESADIIVTASHAPAQDLTIAYTYSDNDATAGEDYDGTAGTVTIPAGQTSVAFKATLLQDDIFEDSETFRVLLSVSPDYLPGSVRSVIVTILDDEEPEVGFEKAEHWALENSGSVDVNLTLDTDIELDIAVTLAVSGTATAGSDYTALPSTTVTMPAGTTAGSTHTVTIPILDDGNVEPDETIILTISTFSSTRVDKADQDSTTVFIADEDSVVGGLVVSPSSVTVREGGSATYRVRPATAPTQSFIQLTITGQSASTLTLDANDAMNGDQAFVRFNATNWWIGRTITVRGVHDRDTTDDTVTLSHATIGGGYDSVAAVDVTATVDDEDVTLSIAGGDPVTEGTPAEVTVTADPPPDRNIEVKFSFTDAENADFLHSQFDSGLNRRFNANNTEQTYRFNTEADSVSEPSGPITITLEAGDSYAIDSSAASAMVQVNDDDTADVLVSWSQTDDSALPAAIQVTEGGPAFTVKVSLASAAPAGGISIPIEVTHSETSGTTAGDITVPANVTIAAGQTSATFTVQANIDEMLEGGEVFLLTLCPTASCPAGYTSGDTPPLVLGQALDPGLIADFSKFINVSTNDDNTTTLTYYPGQEGGEVTLGVKLAVDPQVDVTITPKVVGGNQTGNLVFEPNLINGTATEFVAVDTDPDTDGLQSTLTFTGGNSGNWNAEQSFTLYFLYDDDVTNEDEEAGQEGDVYTIGFLNEAASGPYKAQTHNGELYVGLTTFRVADAGNAVVVSPDAVSVAASGTVEYDVQLASDPGGTVVVTPTSSDLTKATVSSALTFTTSDWNTPQQITVTGVGTGSTTITHAVTTATTAYPISLTIEDVDVTVTPAARNLDIQVADAYEGENIVVTLTLSQAPGNVPAAQRTFEVNPGVPSATAVTTCIASHGCTAGSMLAAATDFTSSGSVNVVFGANETVKTASIPVVADSVSEGVEVVEFDIRYQSGTSDLGIFTADSQITGRNTFSGAAPLLLPGFIFIESYGQILGDTNPAVTVTMSGSDGDANGNAVEGANNATGYRTITLTLGRALTGSETVTVPLTVVGATVTTDYTFALQPSTQTGVTLSTSGSHSAQNPALEFSAGGQTATLRLTPVDNNLRSQPRVNIAYGTGSRAPSASGGATLDTVTGGPQGVTLIDDETTDIEVPANWALAPAGLSAGDEFRLMFITSQTRNARSTNIDAYNEWAAGVVATGGHASLLPYGGLVRVVGSTTGRDARVNTGMWASGAHPDGSTQDSDSGVKIYWLAAPSSDKVADNYFDFYDNSWDGGTDQSGADTTESGAARTDTGSFWTGSNNAGQKADPANRLGSGLPNAANANSGSTLRDSVTSSNSLLPMLVMSPLFKVEAAPPPTVPVISITAGTSPVTEGTDATFTVTATPAPAANLTVNLDVAGDSQFSPSPTDAQTVTIPTSGSVTFTVTTNDDTVDDENGAVSVAVETGNGYTVSSTAGSANVLVHDDDATPSSITLSVDDNSVAEGDSPAPSITVTATVDGSTQFGVNKTVTVSVTPRSDTTSVNYVDMTAVSDFAITIPAGAASHSESFTLTPDDDVVDETNNTVTVSGSISGDSATTINSATITLADDDATPTAITLSASPTTITENGGGQTITVTAAVTGTTFGVAKTVAVAVAGHDTAGAVQFSQVSNFNINIAAEAASGQGQFTLTPTDNNTVDNSGEATISGTLASATVAGASVAITDDDASGPVTVAMAASDGDSDGNAVEGANDATGYRTITLTLGRALAGSESITVPLSVRGATVTTDYTFGLQPTSQTGVSLTTTGGTHTAQRPAVVFSAGASVATLRLTPVDNSARTQPTVIIEYGTGDQAPSASGVTLGALSGDPIIVTLVDDETDEIIVPENWGLRPSGVNPGESFRLVFATSQERTAEETDIDVYNRWARGVVAAYGHADLKPYGGLVTVVGSTQSTDARENTGMWDPSLNSNAGGHADGSASDSDAGVAVYWVHTDPTQSHKVADNYHDFYDGNWDGGNQSSNERNESGNVSNFANQIWTGSLSTGAKHATQYLGANLVAIGSYDSPLHRDGFARTKTESQELYGISPVFTVQAPVLTFGSATYSGAENSSTIDVTVNADYAPSSALTVNLDTGEEGATAGDFTAPGTTFTFPASQDLVHLQRGHHRRQHPGGERGLHADAGHRHRL